MVLSFLQQMGPIVMCRRVQHIFRKTPQHHTYLCNNIPVCNNTKSKLPISWRQSVGSFSSSKDNTVTITYVDPDGEEHPVKAEIGKHLLDTAHDNNIELEGACGGELACSTCHLIFEQDVYDTLPTMSDEEEDMLDLAFELTETSRLGCQINVTKEFEGIKVKIPDDGY